MYVCYQHRSQSYELAKIAPTSSRRAASVCKVQAPHKVNAARPDTLAVEEDGYRKACGAAGAVKDEGDAYGAPHDASTSTSSLSRMAHTILSGTTETAYQRAGRS